MPLLTTLIAGSPVLPYLWFRTCQICIPNRADHMNHGLIRFSRIIASVRAYKILFAVLQRVYLLVYSLTSTLQYYEFYNALNAPCQQLRCTFALFRCSLRCPACQSTELRIAGERHEG
jgi:hypothetical protein